LHQTNIFQLLLSIYEGLSKSGILEVRFSGDSAVNLDTSLNQLIWNMSSVLGFSNILNEVDMVIFVSFEFNWERDHVFDEFVLAVEQYLRCELVACYVVLSTIVIKTKEFEFTIRDLSLKEFLMNLVGRILNNNQKLRFGMVWRIILVVDFS